MGFNDTFMLNLERHGASPPDYPSMTNAQRVAASTDTGNLHWVGGNVKASSGVLTAGKVGDHVRMFAPNPAQPLSSVSHWDTVLTPDQIMDPGDTRPLHNPVLELPLLQDIGWTLLSASPNTVDVSVWLLNGLQPPPSGTVGGPVGLADFEIVGVGDVNADGRADLVWRNLHTGQVSVWLLNGLQPPPSGTVGGPVGLAAEIVGVGDVNADGRADLVWLTPGASPNTVDVGVAP